jgi:pyridinium-3,5-biscarboxylic acid mononucleotide sulfurtransferase
MTRLTTIAGETRVREALRRYDRLAIAVSGGVDSMTLAHLAHRERGAVLMLHAVSPAVPAHATERVKAHAARENWRLAIIGAGEFADPRYRDNPVDRCYFCKTNLYARIAAFTDAPIASGANLDDLGDYRPGLLAAAEHAVVHPFVEAEIDKAGVRAIARRLELADLAELPAQPCLSSRVETGIPIRADDLAFIDTVERTLAALFQRGTDLRCRVTHRGIVVEVGGEALAAAESAAATVADLCVTEGRVFAGLRPYRRGAAFLRSPP